MEFRNPKEIWSDPPEMVVDFGRIFCIGLFVIGAGAQWYAIDWQCSWTQFVANSHIGFYFWLIGGVVLTLATIASWCVRPLYFLWLLLGQTLGWVVHHIIFTAVYYLVFTPVGLLYRRRCRVVTKAPDPELSTYWEGKHTGSDEKSYYRQF